MEPPLKFSHVWVYVAPKDVALRVITSAEWAPCVPGYWLPGHVWHTPLEGYVLAPDLTCPVFEDISLLARARLLPSLSVLMVQKTGGRKTSCVCTAANLGTCHSNVRSRRVGNLPLPCLLPLPSRQMPSSTFV